MTDLKPHTILVVDDDEGICDLLGKFLQQHGFATELAHNGDEMETILQRGNTDLVILDILMPGKDGLTLCREIRNQSQIPIIMLTAISEDVDRILGLEMGADDYLSKPFNPRELLARVKAILRRSAGNNHDHPPGEVDHRHTYLQFSDWTLDKTARRLFSPDNLEISLSTGEYSLLLALLEREQQVLSRDQLLDITKNRSCGPFDRSIDIQISRLRHKIEKDHKKPNLIKTVRGGGYVLATTVKMTQQTEEERVAAL
ncbi:MAG: response regulator [Gammaproteobacteria bacterium]|nr:response regulator [Gammaproteobacteria bacterium]MCH9744443.1 response regulator [Gammaproteobacteria bacterium]